MHIKNENEENQSVKGEEMAEAEEMAIRDLGGELVCFLRRSQHNSS